MGIADAVTDIALWDDRAFRQAGDATGRITAWDVRTGEAQPPFEGHTQPVFSTVSGRANNFRHISSAADGTLRMWDRGGLRPILTLPGTATRFCLDNFERRVGPVSWDGRTGWCDLHWPRGFALLSPPVKSDGVRAITWHPDGGLFASLTGNSAVVFRRGKGSSNTLIIPANRPEALRFTPNGRWLAAGSPGNADATVWDLETGKVATEPATVRTARSWLPVFSPDNHWLAWSRRTALVQRPDNWDSVQPIAAPANESSGRAAAFIPSGTDKTMWLAVAAADEEVHLFRAGTPFTKLLILRPPTGAPAGAMSVSSAGSLVCASPKGEVHLWDFTGLRQETTKLGLGWEKH